MGSTCPAATGDPTGYHCMFKCTRLDSLTLSRMQLSIAYIVRTVTMCTCLLPSARPGCGHRLPQPGKLMIGEELLGYHNNNMSGSIQSGPLIRVVEVNMPALDLLMHAAIIPMQGLTHCYSAHSRLVALLDADHSANV